MTMQYTVGQQKQELTAVGTHTTDHMVAAGESLNFSPLRNPYDQGVTTRDILLGIWEKLNLLVSPPVVFNSTSQAYELSRVVKAAPGSLFGFTGYNSLAATQWIHVFDSISIPLTGAIPTLVIAVNASSPFAWGSTPGMASYLQAVGGRPFTKGIVIANSTTGPTYTPGAANCWFDVQFN